MPRSALKAEFVLSRWTLSCVSSESRQCSLVLQSVLSHWRLSFVSQYAVCGKAIHPPLNIKRGVVDVTLENLGKVSARSERRVAEASEGGGTPGESGNGHFYPPRNTVFYVAIGGRPAQFHWYQEGRR